MQIHFLYPRMLLLLLIIPFLVFIYFFSMVYNKKKSILFANFEAMQRIADVELFSKNLMMLYLNIIIVALLVFSVAGTSVSYVAESSDFSYVLAIDNSESMNTRDISPNRLEAAKEFSKDFIDSLPSGSRVGVISFAGESIVLHEMTNSKMKLKIAIDGIEQGSVQGTSIYNAMVSANKLLEDESRRAVILLSDGQLNVMNVLDVVDYANRNDVLVNSVGVGTLEGGLTSFNTISKVDEDFLRSLAFNTDGSFFMLDSSDVESVVDKVVERTIKRIDYDLSFIFLLIALGLFCLGWVLHNFRFRVFP